MASRQTSDRDLWCDELDFWLNRSDAALGQRGTLAAVVASLERGGATASGTPSHDGMLRTVCGWRDDEPPSAREHGPVQRVRRLRARWRALSPEHARILAVHYQAREAHHPTEQHLGFCARVCIYLAPNRERLLRACERPSDGGSLQLRQAARERGERAVRAAHRAWQATAQPGDSQPPKTRVQERAQRVADFKNEFGL